MSTTPGMPRGSRRRWVVAVLALSLILSAAVFAAWPRDQAPTATADPHADHFSAVAGGSDAGDPASEVSAVAPPDSDSVGGAPQNSLAAAAGAKPLAHGDAAGGTVTLEPTTGTTSAVVDSSTRDGAAGLGRPRPDVKPTDVIDTNAALGGCSEAYGDNGQCLPGIPPSQAQHAAEMVEAGLDPASMPHLWTCQEVREHFADGIPVRVAGVDPDGLDDDGDGIGCEPD